MLVLVLACVAGQEEGFLSHVAQNIQAVRDPFLQVIFSHPAAPALSALRTLTAPFPPSGHFALPAPPDPPALPKLLQPPNSSTFPSSSSSPNSPSSSCSPNSYSSFSSPNSSSSFSSLTLPAHQPCSNESILYTGPATL